MLFRLHRLASVSKKCNYWTFAAGVVRVSVPFLDAVWYRQLRCTITALRFGTTPVSFLEVFSAASDNRFLYLEFDDFVGAVYPSSPYLSILDISRSQATEATFR